MNGPSFRETAPIWAKIGLLSFGGPAGQIALMQDEVVTRKGWVPAESFDRGLAFAMMLPGPEAQQLATWLGWRLGGVWGGLRKWWRRQILQIRPNRLLNALFGRLTRKFGDRRCDLFGCCAICFVNRVFEL